MKNIISNLNRNDGSVVVVALIMLALLSIIGIAATNTSTTEVKISANEQLYRIVFYGADAGLEVGRQVLNDIKIANPGSWDNILAGTAFTWQDAGGNDVNVSTLDQVVDATWNRSVGLATYTLQVVDNDDLDGNPLIDTDNIVVLTSTATYRNAQAQIQATVHYTGPADAYAQEHYNTSNTGEAANENAEIAGTQRW
jgi:Tfp pilus assembly protein PilX